MKLCIYYVFKGIQISATTGNVDLVFDYDSDWSDLGDDEDPDSNDERHQDNDYPEEDDDEVRMKS